MKCAWLYQRRRPGLKSIMLLVATLALLNGMQSARAQCFENPTGETAVGLKNASSYFLTFYIDGVNKGGVPSGDRSVDFLVSPGEHSLRADALIDGETVSASRSVTMAAGEVCTWTVTDPTTRQHSEASSMKESKSSIGNDAFGLPRSPSIATALAQIPVGPAYPLVYADRKAIYYLAANATAPKRIANGTFPAISPDHQQIVFCPPTDNSNAKPSGTVTFLNLQTGARANIFHAAAWIAHLRWSPKGNLISFSAATSDGKRELNIITPRGEVKLKLAAHSVGADDVFSPVWSADGQSLYFHDMNNLFQVGTSGKLIEKTSLASIVGEKESLTSSDSFVPSPVDTGVLAYTRSVQGTRLFEQLFGEPNTALFVYDKRAQSRTRLTAPEMLALDPVWSRDGRFIYFSGYRDREGREPYPFKIYRIGRNGSGQLRIAAGENPDT